MRRIRGYVIGLVVGIVLTLAFTAPWEATAQGDKGPKGVPGDLNGSGTADIADAIYLLDYLFNFGPEPESCEPVEIRTTALPATGQTESHYPGDDGFYETGCPTDGRFVDNGDFTVTDNCTGLMWLQAGVGFASWHHAIDFCENLSLAGHMDWRLPNALELLSVVDYGRHHPCIAPIFQCDGGTYWSATVDAHHPVAGAWVVDFTSGGSGFIDIGVSCSIRAVRTAQ